MNSAESSNRLVDEMLSHMQPPMPITDQHPESKVANFYANKCVFITGATGFIGKALVEKLIRSCNQVKRIYILIREKHGKGIEDRLKDLIRSQYFDRIRQLNNGSNKLLEEKLWPIRGDITLPKFGIDPDDMRLLSENCSIVFNSAATIRFVEPIDVAVRNNIYSVGQLVEFCNELEHLEALIHLSTAYSNCHKRDTIYEIFYEPPMSGDQIQNSIEQLAGIQRQIHVYPENVVDEAKTNGVEQRRELTSHSRNACKLQKFYQDEVNFEINCESSTQTIRSTLDANGSSQRPRPNGPLTASASSASLLLTGETNVGTKPSSVTSVARTKSKEISSPSYDLLAEFTRIALRMSNRPNTYTFTKAISENYLLDKVRARPDRYLSNKIPVAVVRPSIVGGAWREPIVGLVDNYNGPTGAILSLYTGALQAMPGRGDNVADLVPVDMVTNMVICAGWFLASPKGQANSAAGDNLVQIKHDNGVYLFNFVSGFRNPLKWRQVTELISELAYKYPSKFLRRLPSSYFIRAGKFYDLYDALCHKLPAYLMDLYDAKVLRRPYEPRSSAIVGYTRIRQMTQTLTPFTSNQWRLSDSNVKFLFDGLSQADRQVFHFDVASINWFQYITSYIIGSRIYTMRDEPKNVPAAKRRLDKKKQQFNLLLMGLFLMLTYFVFIRNGPLEAIALG